MKNSLLILIGVVTGLTYSSIYHTLTNDHTREDLIECQMDLGQCSALMADASVALNECNTTLLLCGEALDGCK